MILVDGCWLTIGVPHAALRDEVRGPRSGVLRGPTQRPTDQTAQVESCQAGISSCPSSCSLNFKPRSFWGAESRCTKLLKTLETKIGNGIPSVVALDCDFAAGKRF